MNYKVISEKVETFEIGSTYATGSIIWLEIYCNEFIEVLYNYSRDRIFVEPVSPYTKEVIALSKEIELC